MHWQGGGGYGDPLRRDPAVVASDLRADKVSRTGAEEVYGVVFDADGAVDEAATTTRRAALRRTRAGLETEEVTA